MAYGYPYQIQQPVMPSYFNTNYAPPMPQMQQQQTPAANVTWIYVNGWDGARNQIVNVFTSSKSSNVHPNTRAIACNVLSLGF